jgi:deoxycytidine triphosphate deaminase
MENKKDGATTSKPPRSGFLTGSDIRKLFDREIVIYPYDKKNLTPVGYNFTYSNFIYSLSTCSFKKITETETKPAHFYLRPNETVLVLTRETIWVSKHIGGTLHSKVGVIIEGLSHVSTTLDPGWQGQLLVPINNPTNRKIIVPIRDDVGEVLSFITLVLQRSEKESGLEHNNKAARLDLLKDIIVKKSKPGYEKNKLIKLLEDISESVYGKYGIDDNAKPNPNLNESRDLKRDIGIVKKNHDKLGRAMKSKSTQAEILKCSQSSHRKKIIYLIIKILFTMCCFTPLILAFIFVKITLENMYLLASILIPICIAVFQLWLKKDIV